eukprot:GHVL01039085.1.p1 GENE.GHVL01039085.1~~GHVL01039085.1.p1  ORF type:complete len:422 (+),score=93.30 GHVL01039085.1:37-1302(+)
MESEHSVLNLRVDNLSSMIENSPIDLLAQMVEFLRLYQETLLKRGLSDEEIASLERCKYSRLEHRTHHSENLTCPICFCDFEEEDDIIRPCSEQHCFHSDCIIPWLHQSDKCPMCRSQCCSTTGPSSIEQPSRGAITPSLFLVYENNDYTGGVNTRNSLDISNMSRETLLDLSNEELQLDMLEDIRRDNRAEFVSATEVGLVENSEHGVREGWGEEGGGMDEVWVEERRDGGVRVGRGEEVRDGVVREDRGEEVREGGVRGDRGEEVRGGGFRGDRGEEARGGEVGREERGRIHVMMRNEADLIFDALFCPEMENERYIHNNTHNIHNIQNSNNSHSMTDNIHTHNENIHNNINNDDYIHNENINEVENNIQNENISEDEVLNTENTKKKKKWCIITSKIKKFFTKKMSFVNKFKRKNKKK